MLGLVSSVNFTASPNVQSVFNCNGASVCGSFGANVIIRCSGNVMHALKIESAAIARVAAMATTAVSGFFNVICMCVIFGAAARFFKQIYGFFLNGQAGFC